jgi:hypothetical protein
MRRVSPAALLSLLALCACDRIWSIESRALDAHLRCEGGACVCTGGFDDCDGAGDNGCETDLSSSEDHCGACGHGCLGGECSGGRCLPATLAEVASPSTMAHVEGHLYIGSCLKPMLSRLPTSGGAPEVVVEDTGTCVAAIASAEDTLYYATHEGVFSLSLAASPPVPVQLADNQASFLSAGNGHVYWNDRNINNEVFRYSSAKGVQSGFNEDFLPVDALAHGAQRLYWVSLTSGIYGLPHGGDALDMYMELQPEDIVDHFANPIQSFLVDEPIAYFAKKGSVRMLDVGAEGQLSTLLAPAGDPQSLLLDGDFLYWTDSANKEVVRASKYGSADGFTDVLARDDNLSSSTRIVADATTLYWFSSTLKGKGTVFKLAK